MQGFPEQWTTPRDELYIIEKVWPQTEALAVAKSERSGEAQPVIWISKLRQGACVWHYVWPRQCDIH